MRTHTALLAAAPLLAAALIAGPVAAASVATALPVRVAGTAAVHALAAGPPGLAKFTSSVAPAILTTKSCGSIVAGWSCI